MEDESVDAAEFARAVGSGRQFAERVRLERTRRGWSQAELSRRMRAAGQPLDQAAISKIESPPESDRVRRIDIDEAIAFASVFQLSLEQMTIPLATPAELEIMRIVANANRFQKDVEAMQRAYKEALQIVAVAMSISPLIAARVDEQLRNDGSVHGRKFLAAAQLLLQEYEKSDKSIAESAFNGMKAERPGELEEMLANYVHSFSWPTGFVDAHG